MFYSDRRHANLRNTIKNIRYKREERKKSGQNMIATGGMGIGTMKQINDHDSDQAEEAHGIHVNLSRIAVSPLTRLLFSLCCALEVTVPKRVHVINDKAHWSVWETALPVLGTGMTNPKTSGNGNLNIYIYHLRYTSSAAQGGGGSFRNRKPIGEVGWCESRMAEGIH